jgi:hypothetical protein
MFLMALTLLVTASQGFAQTRRGQIELYGGAGFPLGPDTFKDFYKIGLSGNAQYVFFPSPNLGIPIFVGYERFTVDADAISNFYTDIVRSEAEAFGLEFVDASFNSAGSAGILKFGIGVRPYLTKPEASTQFFLFGSGTFNLIKDEFEFKGGSFTVFEPSIGEVSIDITPEDLEAEGVPSKSKSDDQKFGLAGGAGIEIPAGESLNLIFQGLFNVIFTEKTTDPYTGESVGGATTFIGVTAGVIF